MPVYLERRAQRWPTRYTTCIGICMWFLQCDFIFSSCRCEKWIKKWKEKERMIAICPPLDNRTGHKCTYLDCETMRWSNKFPKSMRHRGALYPSALLLFCSFLCFCFFVSQFHSVDIFCGFCRILWSAIFNGILASINSFLFVRSLALCVWLYGSEAPVGGNQRWFCGRKFWLIKSSYLWRMYEELFTNVASLRFNLLEQHHPPRGWSLLFRNVRMERNSICSFIFIPSQIESYSSKAKKLCIIIMNPRQHIHTNVLYIVCTSTANIDPIRIKGEHEKHTKCTK